MTTFGRSGKLRSSGVGSLTDVVYTKAVVEDIAHISEEATTAARAAESLVQPPPA